MAGSQVAPDTTTPDEEMECVYRRSPSLTDARMHYCPGCTHGIIHQLVAQMVDEFGLFERTVGIVPVGCAVLAYNYFDFDTIEASHGRAPAVATGVKRTDPGRFVFTYQGDGDLAAIGIGETIHAAARGERITIFFVNNGIYGMTGGQMAPTTLPGQKTTTTPGGRDPRYTGSPLSVCELLATLPGVAFAARVPLTGPKGINRARKLMRKAIRAQLEDKGLGLVEFLSTCPVQWHMTPVEAMRYVDQTVVRTFPPGVFVDRVDEAPQGAAPTGGKRK